MRRQIQLVDTVMIRAIERVQMRNKVTILPMLNPNRRVLLIFQKRCMAISR